MATIITQFHPWRETLRKHKEQPPSHLWNTLDSRLAHHKTSRKLKYTRLLTIAAGLLIVIMAGASLIFFDNNMSSSQDRYSKNLMQLETHTPSNSEDGIFSPEKIKAWKREAAIAYR